jgi:pentatricopeptide repeat protein
MVNFGVEPNVHTYGALIDGCARAGQVAKAFGAYGIMRSKVQLLQLIFLKN